ncbi:MAG: hypothetical protein DSY33_06245 [Archaeoglobus sp.]|nr:MAG: hypothetical protein DSY33_06245 [Archaeoglobus sp.]
MYLYPVEVVADMYVSRVGGCSPELDRGEIGINANAISSNTSLIAGESMARLRFFNSNRPFFLRKRYRIIGLEEHMEGYGLSKNGEVVFSELEYRSEFEGKEVIINAVEDFRIGDDLKSVVMAMREKLRHIKI